MYIFKNALTSIIRNKTRNLLIGIIIIVISSAVTISLAINNSSSSLISAYQDKYETEATIGINRENMMKDFNPDDKDNSKDNMKEMFNSASSVTEEDVTNYGDSKYVKSYYYTISSGINIDGVEKASSNDDKGKGPNKENIISTSYDFTLTGYSSLSAMNEFIDGSYKITDGEVSEDFTDNSCLINSELATLNNLSVGDTIKIVDYNNSDITYDLVISGIYEEESDKDSKMSMFSNSVNTIITNVSVVNKLKESDSDLELSVSPTFVLTSSDVVDKFTSELEEKGLDENLTVETNLDEVEKATSSISNVKTFAITFLIITFIIGTIILLVINMINIRERKYEIGVLRTIGMKKSKVCMQFMIELFIVAVVSIGLGASIGAVLSSPVSNKLLSSEIESSKSEASLVSNNFGKGEMDIDSKKDDNNKDDDNAKEFKSIAGTSAFESIDAKVDIIVLLELLGIGILITFISSISATISIQRFSPLTILKERS